MKNQRKMIDALLLLERWCWWVASTAASFISIIGLELKQLAIGRRGQKLLSHREIYARNILKYWQTDGRSGASRGIYIGRVGRYNSSRHLRVGQSEEVVR